jgi:hypothetical protein
MNIAYSISDRREGVRMALAGLGKVNSHLGAHKSSIGYHEQELKLAIEFDDRKGEMAALANLGSLYYLTENYAKAVDFYERSLEISLEIAVREGESIALGNLGVIYRHLREYSKAIIYHQQSLTVSREIQFRLREAETLHDWGITLKEDNQFQEALEKLQESLSLFKEITHPIGEAKILKELAEFYLSKPNISQTDLNFSERFCKEAFTIAKTTQVQPLVAACQGIFNLISEKEQNILHKQEMEERENQINQRDEKMRDMKSTIESLGVSTGNLVDFVIITAIRIERSAVLKAFGIDEGKDRVQKGSHTYWRKSMSLKNGKFYEIIVAKSLDMANVNSAILANQALNDWRPTSILMVGIAAAAKPLPKQHLGDLIIAKEVYYYEMGKITSEGKLPEPKQYPVDAALLDRVEGCD